MNDAEMIAGLKERLTSILRSDFKGRPARMAASASVAGTTLKHWFDKWKAGEAVNPNAVALFKVARACGVSVEWLLTGEGPEQVMPARNDIPGWLEPLLPKVAELDRASRDQLVGYIKGFVDAQAQKKDESSKRRRAS